jgi:hypothetical protein
VAKMDKKATAKSKRKEINKHFIVKMQCNFIGLVSSDRLLIKAQSINAIKEIGDKLKRPEENSQSISCLEFFEQYIPIQTIAPPSYNLKSS